jgi:hypothetical protein
VESWAPFGCVHRISTCAQSADHPAQTTQENKEDIGEIAQHIESVIQSLAEFTVPTSLEPGLDFVSSGAVSRVKGFNTYVGAHPGHDQH